VALAVAGADDPPPLLQVDRLEEYVARLSRHPGRTVGLDYSRASARDAGLTVDLVVTEAKPWTTYFQTTDTGTENTGEYRNRVGFSHTQLTGNDDILQLEYLTSDFDEVQAASGSYEAPIPGLDMARFKLFGAMSRFDNDDLGIFSGDFQGTRSEVGLRMLGNVLQRRSLFVDLSLGLRAESLTVDNGILRVKARDHFVLPSLGLRFERRTPFSGFAGGLELEGNMAGLAGTDTEELNAFGLPDRAGGLGRTDADAHFGILRFDFAGSLFLEPLLSGSADSLANELSLRAGGQYALEDRLVPQEQAIAGGRDTVRGYEQAVAVGDSVYLASLEYRYHFPRALTPRRAQPLPLWLRWAQLGSDRFRLAPEQPSGPTDWDLVLKAFVDFARVLQSDRLSFESHETLLGAGIGVELRLRQNFTLALDLGFPLEEGHLLDVDRGDPVLHFSLTALY
jgi:hemolysin activation/secretion protein